MEVIKQRKGSAGAIAKNKITSAIIKEKYYLNPSVCKECNNIIHPIIKGNKTDFAGARVKKFCNQSCSAIFNNKQRELNIDYTLIREIKKLTLRNINSIKHYDTCNCGDLKRSKAKTCRKCYDLNSISNRTYKDLKNNYNNWWEARVPISKNARKVYQQLNGDTSCNKCGYDKHIQVCHIKAVSEFDENTLIKDINNINNLIGLCPNCHWEYDNNLLKL